MLAVKNKKINHMVYVSSDAVYSDSLEPTSEESLKSYNLYDYVFN